jgi:hypothetical protein
VTETVYGGNNVLDDTTAGAEATFVAQQNAKGARNTFSSVSADTYTVSGYDQAGTEVWYEHMIIESNVEYGIDRAYPASLAARINPEVTVSERGFVPGPDRSA